MKLKLSTLLSSNSGFLNSGSFHIKKKHSKRNFIQFQSPGVVYAICHTHIPVAYTYTHYLLCARLHCRGYDKRRRDDDDDRLRVRHCTPGNRRSQHTSDPKARIKRRRRRRRSRNLFVYMARSRSYIYRAKAISGRETTYKHVKVYGKATSTSYTSKTYDCEMQCSFPSRWEGTWFQSGVRQSILISKNILSSKGTCLHNEGDKFLLVDEKSCYRCVVIHEKHSNVLQYKETYCHGRSSLSSLCSYITGDALLFSMFREEATSVPCPFHGPMTFTYNRGHGRCSSPLSNVDTCTDESRLLFRYQACPDVPASESTVEELECLATWKEGSNRYLVGRLHNGHSLSNEDRYRCFVYERGGQSVAGLNRAAAAALGIATVIDHDLPASGTLTEGSSEIYKVAQSGDATCNGLSSPLEGSRTMTLTKASSPGKCWFPTWLTGKTSLMWHTLDLSAAYTFHMSNASLQTVKSNGSARSPESPANFLNLPGQEEHNVKILCNSVKVADVEQNIYMIVAHYTVGCPLSSLKSSKKYKLNKIENIRNILRGPQKELSQNNNLWKTFCYEAVLAQRLRKIVSHLHEIFDLETANNGFKMNAMPARHREYGRRRMTRQTAANCCTLVYDAAGAKCAATATAISMRSFELAPSSPEPRQCPYLGKFTVTSLNGHAPKKSSSGVGSGFKSYSTKNEQARHGQERKLEFEIEKRRGNNQYLVHEQQARRRVRSGSQQQQQQQKAQPKIHGSELESSLEQRLAQERLWLKAAGLAEAHHRADEAHFKTKHRSQRQAQVDDFQADTDDTTKSRQMVVDKVAAAPGGQQHLSWEARKKKKQREQHVYPSNLGYSDLLRMKRDMEEDEEDVDEEDDDDYQDYEERRRRRRKRQDVLEEEPRRCNSDVTTLTVGCSTADRMEFQSDCVDEDFAYSCHGRWFDAEGTQFVIATQVARRPPPAWSGIPEVTRAQPLRNTRRLCFMYRESGGVVSLSASSVACQRGMPSPAPLLAFNATSI
ncbi:unnamed protein product, partial [Trichogramma brassicae]